MGALDVVGFEEGFQRDLPVAVEQAPEAEAIAHPVEFERVDQRGDRLEEFAQRAGVRIHVDPDPATPGIDLHRGKAGAAGVKRALPVFLVGDIGGLAIEPEGPGVVVAAEFQLAAPGGMGAGVLRDRLRPAAGVVANQAPAAVRADVVEGLQAGRRVAHDQDRIVADVVGDVVTHLLQFLDAAGLLPDLRPQTFRLRFGIFAADEGFRRIGQRFRKIVGDRVFGLVHGILLFAAGYSAGSATASRSRVSPCSEPSARHFASMSSKA